MASSAKDIQFKELKDTISQLNTTIRTQNDLIVSLQKMLEERNAKDDEKYPDHCQIHPSNGS